MKNFISVIPLLSMKILTLGCSNKPEGGEINENPNVFWWQRKDIKKAYKFDYEGAHYMDNKNDAMQYLQKTIKNEGFITPIFDQL